MLKKKIFPQLKDFAAIKDIPKNITAEAIKIAEKNLEWLKKNKQSLDTWLRTNAKVNNGANKILSGSIAMPLSLLALILFYLY